MSIDFDCFLEHKPSVKIKSIEGDNWQIAVYGPMKFEREDLPSVILENVGDRPWLLQIHLEGQLNEETFKEFETLMSVLVEKHNACIYDPQQDCTYSQQGQIPISRD